ncbi:hypothetical protein NQ166_03485 [Microbacterium sp. zg.Y1090]|uniref:esterase/lipase family protein n=1 Tax=Microbacterium TaxID=33882 RepID=UPI00214B452A|nr:MULTISPECIES: hypothetical protein [unclassified Microbacterium]MCR2814105.1 hypothetical protein [Microbacterium sp. zg.Y1084]MCR2817890.1 hypothetical protein [Microbacterium sp. zg.Y1090]MDL5487744.1 hypothetical protein [Microbacterium sp. zg-Y1211]WIM27941.1 hypothetical protein QNO26_12430 [Microbacterium sp. zg-Y1090]
MPGRLRGSQIARIALGLVAVIVYTSSGVPLPSHAAADAAPAAERSTAAPSDRADAARGTLVSLSDPERVAEADQAVLFVHGWLSTSLPSADGAQPGIAQSPFAHHAAADGGKVSAAALGRPMASSAAPGSVQEALEALPGTTLHAFDYSQTSSAWVGGDAVVDGLADAIRTLAEQTQAPVDVVAHSMGGLAMRHAVSAHPDLVPLVGQVVTVGTPSLGSDAAALLDAISLVTGTVIGAGSAARALIVPALVDLCNRDLAADAMNGCGLPTWLRTSIANTGEAGRALHVGSEELRSMPAWPESLAVHAVAGDARLRVGEMVLSFGDGLVSRASAVADADTTFEARCEERVSPDALGIAALLRGDAVVPFGGGECAHDGLLRNRDVVDDVVRVLTGMPARGPMARVP